MEAFFNSFALVFVGEMGDKTQLLALLLSSRYHKPWTILAGILVATLLNHALASWAGTYLAAIVSPDQLKWILAISFFAFAIWILIPDKEDEPRASGKLGVFATTTVAFFLAEMGDKTQLATIALGARYANLTIVTAGTSVGMVASNALAIFIGKKFLSKLPFAWIRAFASLLFAAFGVAILIQLRAS